MNTMTNEMVALMNNIATDMVRANNQTEAANKRLVNMYHGMVKQLTVINNCLMDTSNIEDETVVNIFSNYVEVATCIDSILENYKVMADNYRVNGRYNIASDSSIITNLNNKISALEALNNELNAEVQCYKYGESEYIEQQREKLNIVYHSLKGNNTQDKVVELGLDYSKALDMVEELEAKNMELATRITDLSKYGGIHKQNEKLKNGAKIAVNANLSDEEAARLYLEGYSVKDIASTYGMTYHGVRAKIVRQGAWVDKVQGGQRKERTE